MKRWIVVAAALLLTPAGACYPAAAKSYAHDDQEIAALMQRVEAAVNAKDLEGVMSAYVGDDSLFLFDLIPPRQYVGVAAMRRHWQEDFFAMSKGPLNYTIADLVVTTDGTLAYSHSIQRLRCTDTQGHSVDVTMRFTDDYRKIDGRWYIVMEHVSVPIDMRTLTPDLSSRP